MHNKNKSFCILKPIILTVLAAIFCGPLIGVPVGYCENPNSSAAKEHLRHFTDAERTQFQKQADIIFEGTIANVATFKGDSANALEGDLSKYKNSDEAFDDLELDWLAIFKVDNVIKGQFTKDKYEILVHSPVDSFGFHISDSERNKKSAYGEEKYRIYIQNFPIGPSMIAVEILSE